MQASLNAIYQGAEWQLVWYSLYQASLRERPAIYGVRILEDLLSKGVHTRAEAEALAHQRKEPVPTAAGESKPRDERYSAFYDLFPDS